MMLAFSRYYYLLFQNFRSNNVRYIGNLFSFISKTKRHQYYCLRTVFKEASFSSYNHIKIGNNYVSKNPRGEKFVEKENIFAHEVLENNAAYINTVLLHPLNSMSKFNINSPVTSDESVNTFYRATVRNFEQQRVLDDQVFTNVVRSLVKQIPDVKFDDIRLILFYLCLWPSGPSAYGQNFKILWNSLDQECSQKLKYWTTDQKLLIADYWFHLGLSRISTYNTQMVIDLAKNCDQLTNEQFVHLMFFITLQKTFPKLFLNHFLPKFESVIKSVSVEETSVICLSYFKNDVKVINHNILKTILNQTISKGDKLDPTAFVRIIKFLRKGFQDHIIQCYVPLLKACVINLKHWDLLAAVHIAIFCSTSYIFEPALLDVIEDKLKENISNARLKDISKIIQCFSQFNYMQDSNFYNVLFDEVMKPKRLEECTKFPRELLNLVLFYAYMGKYPLHVIKYILHSDFVELCQSKCDEELLRMLAIIDYCIEIECKNYDGPRLKPNLLHVLEENRKKLISESNLKSNIISEVTKKVINGLSDFFPSDDYLSQYILPHSFNPDVIIRLSKANQSISLVDTVKSWQPGMIFVPPPCESWGCLVICGPFSFPYKSNRLCGLITMKQRQLKLLGYKVVLIPHKELPFRGQERKRYLEQKINSLYKEVESITS